MAKEARVDINDAKVKEMMSNPNFRREFPFLATAHKRLQTAEGRKCNKCGSKQVSNQAEYNQLKVAIASLPADRMIKLKEMLNTNQAAVKIPRDKGGVVVLKF